MAENDPPGSPEERKHRFLDELLSNMKAHSANAKGENAYMPLGKNELERFQEQQRFNRSFPYERIERQLEQLKKEQDPDKQFYLALEMGREFLRVCERGNIKFLMIFKRLGFPLSYQDPITSQTGLTKAAASKARGSIRFLVSSGQCDYLKRDKHGRLASEIAYVFGGDPAVSRLLAIKQRKQADAQGVKLTRRP